MVVEEGEKCVGNAEEAVDDALDADTSKMSCVRYAVGGFHTQLAPYTAAGADAVAGGGEYDDDRGDDDGGHSATIDHPGHPKA